MSKLPTTKRRPSRDLGTVLLEIVDREGGLILSRILREKAQSAPEPSSEGSSLTSRAAVAARTAVSEVQRFGVVEFSRRRTERTLLGVRETWLAAQALPKVLNPLLEAARVRSPGVPTLREKGEVALFSLLFSGSYLGGLFLGLQLPNVDLSLTRQGAPGTGTAVIVHSAPAFTVDTFFRWLVAVVQRTLEHPSIGEEDRRGLRAVETLLETLLNGVTTGVSTQKFVLERLMAARGSRPMLKYALDEQAYRILEMVFRSFGDEPE